MIEEAAPTAFSAQIVQKCEARVVRQDRISGCA
jgi:hypothetical protein